MQGEAQGAVATGELSLDLRYDRYGFRVGQSSTFHGLNMPNVSQLHGQMDAVIKLQPWQ